MALARVTTWSAGQVLTASALNGEFDNLITNCIAIGAATTSGLTMSTARLLGRTTAGGGAIEEISVSGATLSSTTLTITSPAPKGGEIYTNGTILSNNAADATNDIDIAACEIVSNDATAANRVVITLAALTKQLDAVWAVGTNQGGRASGAAIANTTYYVFAIYRSDTAVSDVAFDTSATGANVTANTNAAYTKMARIGAILREGGSIVAFVQDGPVYRRQTPVLDVSSTNPGTNAVTRTLSVPVGINVEALMNVGVEPTSTGPGLQWYLSDLATVDVAASPSSAPLGTLSGGASAANAGLTGQAMVRVNTSAQIRSRTDVSGANDKFYIATTGWIDWTGRA